MMKKNFFETTFTIKVLSEKPIEGIDLQDLDYEVNEGHSVLRSRREKIKSLTGKQMANALYDAGSDPSFFQLDDERKRN